MTKEADSPTHIGISLGPHRSQALAVRDRTVLESITVAGSDPAELLSLIRPAHRARARSVTVDISRLLLEPVLHRPAGLSPVALLREHTSPATDPALGRHAAGGIGRLVA